MSRKILNLTGQQIGQWTVGERIVKNGSSYFHCKCSCGREKEVCGYLLKTGGSLSCGHSRKLGKVKDIKGQRFYSLVALEPKTVENRTYWLCQCDCGNTKLVLGKHLRKGDIKNCGCGLGSLERRQEGLKEYCKDGTYVPGLKRKHLNKNNSSGVVGVNYRKDRGKWRAYIRFQGKHIFLGNYDTKEQAIAARRAGEKHYFGKYLNSSNKVLTES